MAEYTPIPTRAWSSVLFAQNGDGTGTFWANTMVPVYNRIHTIAYYLVSGGTIPASGASLNSQGAAPDDPDGLSLIGFSGKAGAAAPFDAASTARELAENLIEFKENAAAVVVTGPDSDATFTITNQAIIMAPELATVGRTYTIGEAPYDGYRLRVHRDPDAGTQDLVLEDAAAAEILTLAPTAPAVGSWADLVSDGATWLVTAHGGNVT